MHRLLNVNPYTQLFQHKVDVKQIWNKPILILFLFTISFFLRNTFDKRHYDLSTTVEIASVFLSDDRGPSNNISFTIHSEVFGHRIKIISALDSDTEPISYPLLFVRRESLRKLWMSLDSVHTTLVCNVVTQLQYYSYRLAIRGGFSPLPSFGRLFQQYVVDSYIKILSKTK